MSNIHPDLLRRYALGQCTAEERQRVAHWLEQGDQDPSELQAAPRDDSAVKAELWEGLLEKAARKRERSLRKKWIIGSSIAASVIAVWALFLFNNNGIFHQQESFSMRQYTAPKGKLVSLRLEDGTVVQLAGGSRLQYPSRFGKKSRTVRLTSGKAFFSVRHQVERPFMVKTAGTTITVLGTRFNVEQIGADFINVTLTQGSILFRDQAKEQKLVPGELLRYDQLKQRIQSVSAVDTNLVTGWTTGTLYFQQTPISEVLKQLESQYGIQFQVSGNPDLEVPLSGKFQQQPLARILRLIENSTELTFSQPVGDRITVR